MDSPSDIPVETWLQILQSCSKQELRSLALVSSYFRDLCQPLLFEEQYFTARQGWISESPWIPVTERLHWSKIRLRNLAASSHALSVRHWSFHANPEIAGLPDRIPTVLNINLLPETYNSVVEVFSSTLTAYENLRSLHLSRFTIDGTIRTTLTSLGRLDELKMSGCILLGRTGPLLPLRSFALIESAHPVQSGPEESMQLVSPETLRTLTIDGSPDACTLLTTVGKLPFPILSNLTVRLSTLPDERALVFAFLDRCPCLSHIDVSAPSSFSGTMPVRLSPTTIPRLTSFKGPRSLAPLFTHNRPVTAVELADHVHDSASRLSREILRTLQVLTESPVALRSLTLDLSLGATAEVCAQIGALFPELQALTLRIVPPGRNGLRTAHDDEGGMFSMHELMELRATEDDMGRGFLQAVDERVPNLPDDEDVAAAAMIQRRNILSRARGHHASFRRAEFSPEPQQVQPPVAHPAPRVPGFMYTMGGTSFPPPTPITPTPEPPSSTTSTPQAPSGLEAAIIRNLPPTARMPATSFEELSDAEQWQHRAVLTLGHDLAALEELTFASDNYAAVWKKKRQGGIWIWTEQLTSAVIVAL
ncbi:hypothetical protein C8R43DRAFT_169035 [Mycena crocata]|nr:hypothetical protein C8R43DRAFT_169035 [Mycena crocata]